MGEPRTIGIVGPPYCGSTLVNYVLGALPGVVALGETQWLCEGLSDSRTGHWGELGPRCLVHHTDCPVLTAQTLQAFFTRRPDWYTALAQACGTDTLVVADKSPDIYRALGTPSLGLLVFKDPRANAWSIIRRRHHALWAAGRFDEAVDLAVAEIVEHYEGGLGLIGPKRRVVFPVEAFARNPMYALMALTVRLKVPFAPEALRFWEHTDRLHLLGGNFVPQDHAGRGKDEPGWAARFQRRFGRDDRWRDAMSPESARRVLEHGRLAAVYSALRDESLMPWVRQGEA